MNKKPRLPLLFVSTLLLASCSGVMDSAQPAKQYYMLSPLSGGAGTGGTAQGPELSLAVSAVPGLDSDRVQALSGDARLNYYANARWPDHLPEVLTSVIKRSLSASGQFSGVTQGNRVRGDGWLLQLEVQQFFVLPSFRRPLNGSSIPAPLTVSICPTISSLGAPGLGSLTTRLSRPGRASTV